MSDYTVKWAGEMAQYADLAARSEAHGWAAADIAKAAVDSGEYTQASFAEAVGSSQSVIQRQCKAATNYPDRGNRPSFSEAYGDGRPSGNAKSEILDPDKLAKLLADPAVSEALIRGIYEASGQGAGPSSSGPDPTALQILASWAKADLDKVERLIGYQWDPSLIEATTAVDEALQNGRAFLAQWAGVQVS